ncbi:hypothetical protein EYZ11_003853 [Aspergillus tanneri]|uniref:GPI inositol-deacylase n=1 Tax=Aspergillus tanneri TaxID=1220188 RepID=A0A4S3JPC1_9EURO|nr:uncharacterized protein ATNIH1004_005846 [Aspergillus tanneri]KAA8647158.1 hypothetical protein ATNIH1004_005846 [Aspergillus tanneri]THC96648.1 hypothetical protein EYZ11_003853 [Aspergillus tanneri]
MLRQNESIRNIKPSDTKQSSGTQHNSFGSIDENFSTTAGDIRRNLKGHLGLNLLHSPLQTLVEFIFVHGLGGGSMKTWSNSSSISDYWPQAWLPEDPAFKNTRIHSFGYNSDWNKGDDNCLNIHHFAKSLLGELSTSPSLSSASTPIVFIGHSMGGLVVKKAYLLARQDAFYDTLVKRIHTMYFFATPHRGSDSAKLLEHLLQITYSSRAYVSDLKRGSEALQSVNDEFRKYSDMIEFWSFYETKKLKVGFFSTLIVDPDSATLGYREEHQIPLNADHRSICKFGTPQDPNYITVRNALASTVTRISHLVLNSKESIARTQIKDLKEYLGAPETLDDLILVEDARMPGTCEWLETKKSYVRWSSFDFKAPHIFWVDGKPAAGKSVLAGYIIDKLRRKGNCSFYFFKYGDKSKSRLDNCLRSLAFQMACKDSHVQQAILEMQKNDIKLDSTDERIIWRKLFLSGIFQAKLEKHYWVIDALDESANIASFFDTVLAKLDLSIPLRILVTSRERAEIGKHLSGLDSHAFQSEKISTSDTLNDIKLLVEARARSLMVKDDKDRVVLMDKILEKSQGSFLWTVLVLDELSYSYTRLEINQVLEEVPPGMELLYQRSLDSMSLASRGKQLSSAILTWSTCATRPLKSNELAYALKLDTGDSFPKLQDAIGAVCGQLVTVDKFDNVRLVHETVREFLLRDDLASEFAINTGVAHTRIARVCLLYLTGEEMKPPRSRRSASVFTGEQRAEFSTYAYATFSYHLSKADPLAHDVFLLLDKFLKSNILSWIEVIARSKDLTPLIRTAKHLKVYLNSCKVQRSPLSGAMQTIKGWTTDLVRIAAKFADALIISPSSIYSLILPFCPKKSTVYKTTHPGRKLSVVGLSSTEWDDRLTSIEFRQSQTTAICYGDEFFAVGLSSGRIAVYNATTYQEYRSLNHGEAVRILQVGGKPELIAACGLESIHLWEIRHGHLIHRFQSPHRSVGLAFDRDLLIVACSKNYLTSWDLSNDGVRLPDRPWNDSEDTNIKTRRVPSAISISVGHQMLAAVYSGRPITLWDLREDTYYGSCGKKLPDGETSTHLVTALIFNPNPAINRLVASYLDGDLVLLDPFTDEVIVSLRADCHTLATSADGCLLAGSAGSGIIQIYEFDTLAMLYRVQSSSYYIKQLAFSKDSLHFADIRGSKCNIWEPTALLRNSISDDSSENTSTTVVETVAIDSKARISVMVADPSEGIVFCSKDDGSVCIYDLNSGVNLRTIYSHKSSVSTLAWWPQRKVIMSADVSNRIFAWSLESPRERLLGDKELFQSRLGCGQAITQVLPSDTVGKFILSTRETDHLWNISGHEEGVRAFRERPGIRKWIQHQQSPHHIISFEGTTARIYTWSDWSEVATVELNIDLTGLQIKNIIPYASRNRKRVLIELSELDGSANTCDLYLLGGLPYSTKFIRPYEANLEKSKIGLEAGKTSDDGERTQDGDVLTPLISKRLSSLKHHVAHIIGLDVSSRIVFLDNYSWVCSVDLEEPENNPVLYMRHFFVPYDWFSGARNVVALVTRRDVLIARNSDVAIVRAGLEYGQASNMDSVQI